MKTMVMEQFNGILFHKSGAANKQHANRSSSSLAVLEFPVKHVAAFFNANRIVFCVKAHIDYIFLMSWGIPGAVH